MRYTNREVYTIVPHSSSLEFCAFEEAHAYFFAAEKKSDVSPFLHPSFYVDLLALIDESHL